MSKAELKDSGSIILQHKFGQIGTVHKISNYDDIADLLNDGWNFIIDDSCGILLTKDKKFIHIKQLSRQEIICEKWLHNNLNFQFKLIPSVISSEILPFVSVINSNISEDIMKYIIEFISIYKCAKPVIKWMHLHNGFLPGFMYDDMLFLMNIDNYKLHYISPPYDNIDIAYFNIENKHKTISQFIRNFKVSKYVLEEDKGILSSKCVDQFGIYTLAYPSTITDRNKYRCGITLIKDINHNTIEHSKHISIVENYSRLFADIQKGEQIRLHNRAIYVGDTIVYSIDEEQYMGYDYKLIIGYKFAVVSFK
jgi:hypothetical protein